MEGAKSVAAAEEGTTASSIAVAPAQGEAARGALLVLAADCIEALQSMRAFQ